MTKRKIFLLGLDGGSWNLLDRLLDAGAMPNLARICREGVKADLKSTIPPVTPVAWTSLMTGAGPGRHGIYGFQQPRTDNSYLMLPQNRLNTRLPTLFDYYREGAGVISLNLPMSYPATPVNGIMVTGMMTPLGDRERSEHPAGTLDRFRAAGIDYVIDPKFAEKDGLKDDEMIRRRAAAGREFVDYLGRVTRARMQAVHLLLDEEDWDLFIAVITGTDRIQHLHWNRLLPPDGGPGDPELLRYYGLVDEEIGRLAARLDADTDLFIVSDHGFTRLHGEMSANQWLLEQGFMARRGDGRSPLVAVKDALKKLGLSRRSLARLLGQDVTSRIQLRAATMDWGRARAYNSSALGIRINLRGRETLGCVDPGEYESLRREIMDRLREVRDDDGDLVVADVFAREDVYVGEHLEDAPDIVFLFREDKLYTAYTSGFWPHVFRRLPDKQADHAMTGIFVARGAGIAPAADKLAFEIRDVLPTIMHLGGRAVPEICDGRVLTEILAAGGPVVRDPDWRRFLAERGELTLDQADVDEINARMRDLGYMQ